MIIKIVAVLFLIFMLFSMGSGLFHLVKDEGRSDRVVKALTWRIALSIGLFLLIMVGYLLGWIQPRM